VNLLIDSHALVWALLDDRRLSPRAQRALSDGSGTLHFSIVSFWELSLKIALGKLHTIGSSIAYLRDECQEHGIQLVPLRVEHILRAESLPPHHRDPFDRMLIAQALHEDLTILSSDEQFQRYPVKTLW
jgi:PIN domain nuclease of toxin-antitoxin system